MRTRPWVCSGVLVLSVVIVATAAAIDIPIPLRSYLNKSGAKTKFVTKGSFALPDPNTDDPVTEGGQINIQSGRGERHDRAAQYELDGARQSARIEGLLKYADPSGATCKKLRVTARLIKGLCRPTTPGAPPYDAGSDAPISIVLAIGTGTQRYCGECPNGGRRGAILSRSPSSGNCQAPPTCPAAVATPTVTATATAAPSLDATKRTML